MDAVCARRARDRGVHARAEAVRARGRRRRRDADLDVLLRAPRESVHVESRRTRRRSGRDGRDARHHANLRVRLRLRPRDGVVPRGVQIRTVRAGVRRVDPPAHAHISRVRACPPASLRDSLRARATTPADPASAPPDPISSTGRRTRNASSPSASSSRCALAQSPTPPPGGRVIITHVFRSPRLVTSARTAVRRSSTSPRIPRRLTHTPNPSIFSIFSHRPSPS